MCEESNKELNKESNKELIETISLKNDDNTIIWYDKNKFNGILSTINSNNFSHKNKIGKFKFNDINDLINNIKNNTISESDTNKKINKLNKIKNVETKDKWLIKNQEKLLSFFDDLKTIFNVNENENESESENESVNENENEDESVNESESESVNENENKSDDRQYYLEQINNNFKEMNKNKIIWRPNRYIKKNTRLRWLLGY